MSYRGEKFVEKPESFMERSGILGYYIGVELKTKILNFHTKDSDQQGRTL